MNKKIKEFLNLREVQIFLALIYIGVLGFVFIPHFIHHAQVGIVPQNQIINCTKVGKTVYITIDDKKFNPEKTIVNVCDKVVFKNIGTKYYDPAFGDHPIHLIYPGYKEVAIKPSETNSIVMSAFGEFEIHEHIYDKIEGEVIVIK